MGVVVINGNSYEVPDGSNISVINNQVLVDGKLLSNETSELQGIVEVKVTGDLNMIKCQYDLKVFGNVAKSVTAGRDVSCKDVGGNVNAGRDVDAGKIEGTVVAGRDVTLGV